jgi:DNA primase
MLKREGIAAVLAATGPQPLEALLLQGYSFAQAVETLAPQLGVSLHNTQHLRQPENEARGQARLLGLVEQAAQFYSTYLWASPSPSAQLGRDYLAHRGIAPATAATFRLGVSPEDHGLCRRFAYQGVQPGHLALAGLGYEDGGDFFRGRLMLPVLRPDGKIGGFGARNQREDQPGGKYINSPTTLVFDKGHALYAPPGLRAACLRAGYVILVEGYIDVITLWQHGFTNVCAIMGTSAAKGQVVRLCSLAPTVVVALDPDLAGQNAAVQAARAAAEMDADVRLAVLQGGDPDELLRMEGGPAYVAAAFAAAQPWVPATEEDQAEATADV